jgi:lipopolysaccharide assembly outer membrane protein LptD (OstA)
MKNMRLSAIGLAFLLACLGISCYREQPEQVYKPGRMTITGTFSTKTESTYPNESPVTTAERRAENVTIESGTLTCTADTALLNKETGHIRLIGDVVVRTTDGIMITAEEVVIGSSSPAETSNSLPR